MSDHRDGAGGREAMMRFTAADDPVVVLARPLFADANSSWPSAVSRT